MVLAPLLLELSLLTSIPIAAARTFPLDGNSLSVSVTDIETSLDINTLSMYATARQAVAGFEKLPKSVLKTFLYTGNILISAPRPLLISLGMGKAASAHVIQAAALGYNERNYR